MKLTKYFMPLAAVALLASCTDDAKNPNGGLEDASGFYLAVNLVPTASSRTASPAVGTENGQPNENKVNDATVILTYLDGTTYNVISSSVATTLGEQTGTTYASSVAKFKQGDVIEFLEGSNNSKPIYVFVVCNSAGLNIQAGQNVQQTLSDLMAPIVGDPSLSIMMTGFNPSPQLTNLTQSQVKAANTADKAISLGDVKVRRAVARLDLNTTPASNTYYFKDGKSDGVTSADYDIAVTMKAVALVNQSKGEYLFKEVSKLNEGNVSTWTWEYAGTDEGETVSNYVNDPNSSAKMNHTYEFYNPVFNTQNKTTPLTYGYTPLTEINGATQTESSGYNNVDGNGYTGAYWSQYKAWKYCIPNSLLDPTKQNNGASTGIVFAATLTGKDESIIKTSPSAKKTNLYAYGNLVIGDIDALKIQGESGDNMALKTDYATALATYKSESSQGAAPEDESDVNIGKYLEALVKQNFKVYKYLDEGAVYSNGDSDKSPAGYYCFYYYWNRHNDNGIKGEMGPMEFAVVRNNVYKLAVTSVSALGHPDDPNNDPEDPTPDTPDEDDPYTYFKVNVEVLPWTVRVNDIEF